MKVAVSNINIKIRQLFSKQRILGFRMTIVKRKIFGDLKQTWYWIMCRPYPVYTGLKLNVHKTSRTSSERLMYVQFTSCVCGVLVILTIKLILILLSNSFSNFFIKMKNEKRKMHFVFHFLWKAFFRRALKYRVKIKHANSGQLFEFHFSYWGKNKM